MRTLDHDDFPPLDEGAIRERIVEDLRRRLQQACDLVALRAQEFGASCWNPEMDPSEASKKLIAAQSAYRVLAFDTFRVLGQALHDADAKVVHNTAMPDATGFPS